MPRSKYFLSEISMKLSVRLLQNIQLFIACSFLFRVFKQIMRKSRRKAIALRFVELTEHNFLNQLIKFFLFIIG